MMWIGTIEDEKGTYEASTPDELYVILPYEDNRTWVAKYSDMNGTKEYYRGKAEAYEKALGVLKEVFQRQK